MHNDKYLTNVSCQTFDQYDDEIINYLELLCV